MGPDYWEKEKIKGMTKGSFFWNRSTYKRLWIKN